MEYLPENNSCDLEEAEALPEDVREALFEVSCHSFRWFDSLFGKSEDFPERDDANGLRTILVKNNGEQGGLQVTSQPTGLQPDVTPVAS